MSIIGARADDWRPGNPTVKPLWWIGGFIAAGIVYIAIIGLIGHIINGDGAPFVGHLG